MQADLVSLVEEAQTAYRKMRKMLSNHPPEEIARRIADDIIPNDAENLLTLALQSPGYATREPDLLRSRMQSDPERPVTATWLIYQNLHDYLLAMLEQFEEDMKEA